MELHSKEMCLVKPRSNSNLHSGNTLFWLKKEIKKRHYGNSGLGLAQDRIEVCKVALFLTTPGN